MKQIVLTLLILVSGALHYVEAQPTAIQLIFNHLIDSQLVRPNSVLYQNHFGESYSIRRLEYYVSDIALITASGLTIAAPSKQYLIKATDTPSTAITFLLPNTNTQLSAIRFTIGIDSIYNTNGVQTGVLDPMNGMFWTWNTGYVFIKLEGQSPDAQVPNHLFSYHIGGYKKGENAVRTVHLSVNAPLRPSNKITINNHIGNFFSSVHAIRISQQPICHQPGFLAMQLADNFAASFSICNNQ